MNNTPYIRYFLAHILQFQFYQHLCQIANQNQPNDDLYRCNFEGNINVGTELKKMLRRVFKLIQLSDWLIVPTIHLKTRIRKGSSQNWKQTMHQFLGTSQFDVKVNFQTGVHFPDGRRLYTDLCGIRMR